MHDKIKSIEELVSIVYGLKSRGKRIVTTNGSFDILHAGHTHLLYKAKLEGDILIVLLNSDKSIQGNKDPRRPIIPEDQRAELIAALEPVDYVTIFPQQKPLDYLTIIRPHVHVKGGSWDPSRVAEEQTLLRQWGGKYVCFELEPGLSTTSIINTILERYTSSS